MKSRPEPRLRHLQVPLSPASPRLTATPITNSPPATTVDPATLGFSIFPQDKAAESVPTINTGYFSLGFSNNGPQPRIDQTYQLDDSFSKVFGHHSFKFGYDGRRFNVSNPFSANNSGTYSYGAGTAFG